VEALGMMRKGSILASLTRKIIMVEQLLQQQLVGPRPHGLLSLLGTLGERIKRGVNLGAGMADSTKSKESIWQAVRGVILVVRDVRASARLPGSYNLNLEEGSVTLSSQSAMLLLMCFRLFLVGLLDVQ
jgi:hypothetical protein